MEWYSSIQFLKFALRAKPNFYELVDNPLPLASLVNGLFDQLAFTA